MPTTQQSGTSGYRLLERESELEALAEALASARGGAGRAVMIEGPAGVGKSELLRAAAGIATAGTAVLRARGAELERDFPFGVALQLLESRLASGSREEREDLLSGAAGPARRLLLEGELGDPPGEDRTFALVHGLHWLCSNLAERAPLVLAVDDAHWTDRSSLRFLLYLSQRIADLPLALVLAARPAEPEAPEDLLRSLAGRRGLVRLQPRPLSGAAVGDVVRSRKPAAAEAFIEACHHLTAGNPFLLHELLGAAEARGIEPSDAGAAELARRAPESVHDAVLARLVRLSPGARELARAVAVLGHDARLDRATRLAGLGTSLAVAAADALVAADILSPADPPGFAHPLLQAAVYADIAPARRAALHLEAANLLSADGEGAPAIGSHLLPATRRQDRWTVERLREAATEAIDRGASESAVRYLTRALEEPPPPEQRGQLLVELGKAESVGAAPAALGRFEQAIPLLQPGDQRARALLELGRLLHRTGRTGDAVETFERGLAEVGGADEPLSRELAAAHFDAALIDPAHAEAARSRLRPMLTRPSGELISSERGLLANVAIGGVFHGERSEDLVELSVHLLADGALLEHEGSDSPVLWNATSCLSWCDELELAERTWTAALEDAARGGSAVAVSHILFGRSWPRYWMGRLSEAAADAGAAVEAWQGAWGMLPVAAYWHCLCLLELDQLEAAIATMETAEEEAWAGTAAHPFLLSGRGLLAAAQDDAARAHDLFLGAGDALRPLAANPAVLPWRSQAAGAAASLGDRPHALRLAEEELRLAREFGARRPIGIALRAAGLVERGDGGIELLREAVLVLERSQAALEHARALVDLGGALRRRNRRVEAREPLRAGLDLAIGFGARALERRAGQELAASGARPRRRELSGIESLTPSERRVAEMAAEGLTNRRIAQSLFVTVKAVQWHLRNGYRKLEVSSREELPEALRGVGGE
jgi:DNA-binding CsgD family transcriptional regulator